MPNTRALQQAIRTFPANPMGRAHDLLQPDNVAQSRRAWALRSAIDPNGPATAGWSLLYVAARTTELARPLTRGVDALCGNGTRGGGVARSGLESDAWLPAQVIKGVGLAAAVGAGMGAVVGWLTGAPQAAHRGAMAGAVVGGALCWAINQGLALAGLIVKVQVLEIAAVLAAVTILLEPQERVTQTYRADLVGFVPMALAQAAKGAWRGVRNWLRAAA